ncbi:MAG: hypothetical protein M1825_005576 [Sarcosagium campestre]|nr:MAG: hypothetical protein M1825_005576 [Sarcosagium campestre]
MTSPQEPLVTSSSNNTNKEDTTSNMIRPTMRALVTGERSIATRLFNGVLGKGISHGVSVSDQVPTPIPSDNELLVKVHSVAQNPTDSFHADYLSPAHSILGCDYAGEVVRVGKDTVSAWKVGDRIAGVSHGGLYPDRGAYAEYLKTESDVAWRVPASVTDEQAATYGVSAITGMQALYLNLDVPWPDEVSSNPSLTSSSPPEILIYAGSTCAGILAIQLAKKSGYRVVTTASPRNFDLVKSYGADAVFDYNSPSALDEVKKGFPNIHRAMDCISKGDSVNFCSQAMAEGGGKVISLLRAAKSKVPNVEVKNIFAYTLLGKPFGILQPLGPKFAAVPSDRAGLVRFYKLLPSLLDDVRPPPIQVLEGGFDALQRGLEMLKKREVSGKKLVVNLSR